MCFFFREIPRNFTNKSCVIVENYVLFNENGADGYAHSKVETKLQKLSKGKIITVVLWNIYLQTKVLQML